MSVLVFAGQQDQKIAKNALEATYYGKLVAEKVGGDVVALSFGDVSDADQLGEYGASKVIVAKSISNLDPSRISKFVQAKATELGASVVIFSNDAFGKMVGARVAAGLKAGMVSGAIEVPNTDGGFVVKKNVFSGKAFAFQSIKSDKKVISLLPNSFKAEKGGAACSVEEDNEAYGDAKVKLVETKVASGDVVPLPEAELVVSAGRGLKGPENWGMVEDLATELGATTACSRPVADIGWRPHHEHVGQTGIAIRPNLYIAIGISGAIQHLAGVNGSKTIVVINTDSEAPFFKAADYGIVGDAFEVVPKLLDAVKKFKASNN